VTGGAATNAFETVLWLGTSRSAGLDPTGNAAAVVDTVWGAFGANNAPANTRRVDGLTLQYWGAPASNNTPDDHKTVAELLASGTGKCQAWADLFLAALDVHGVSATLVGVWPAYGNVVVGGNSRPVDGIEVRASLSGQNIPNPPIHFADHALVRFESSIYDPSYGVRVAGPDKTANAIGWDLAAINSLVVDGAPVPPGTLPRRLTVMRDVVGNAVGPVF
jgi:hypothetical protein